jgi:subtilisin family serine protease
MTASAGYVPVVVPAWQCDSTLNYMCKFGGTSAAAPQVAGIAALLLARRPDFRNSADPAGLIRYVLEGSSEDKGPSGYDTTYGYGRVNAYRALLSVIRGDVTNDGIINASDVSLAGNIVFYGGHAVLDDRTADVNCDGLRSVLDVMYLVNYVFRSGPRPVICFRY